MQYTRIGNLHRLVRVTGPAHNLLGIEFGGETPEKCTVERLDAHSGQPAQFSDEEIRVWVLQAVAAANAELGASLVVKRIQYVASDTRDEKAYVLLAKQLVSKART